ncbi:MAG TPA: hypothetical protein VN231_09445 [Allosphingosinicella sp.]|nr:hypothetical protein [Allosphingosinicella sp.]
MTDLDLERLGGVWRQQPDPAELERLQRSAAAVRRRARLGRVVDVGGAIAVSLVVLLLVLFSPRAETVAMGAAAILVLLVSNVRQRRLRQVELRSLTGSTEDMLDQSIERIEATVGHNRISLIATGPVFGLAMLFAAAAERGAPLRGSLSGAPVLRALWFGAGLAVTVAIVLFLVLAIRRGRRELDRLRAMRDAYRKEKESTSL